MWSKAETLDDKNSWYLGRMLYNHSHNGGRSSQLLEAVHAASGLPMPPTPISIIPSVQLAKRKKTRMAPITGPSICTGQLDANANVGRRDPPPPYGTLRCCPKKLPQVAIISAQLYASDSGPMLIERRSGKRCDDGRR
ncbi:hypothetical protein IAQ61_009385 [Plenodomus lingam]|uniref:uncharacterized protein n=1 Tax=Leptosphaeria maculans TaxID=5022 RepID=UPI00331B36F4|nr:hypothetical protein IAQ61_009385 [Plenodomus lingam]